MPRLLIIIFICFVYQSFGQTKNTSRCKIEIFLLNKKIASFDTAYKLMGKFNVKKKDLEDTAFIKDDEIISYTIEKFKKITVKENIKKSAIIFNSQKT